METSSIRVYQRRVLVRKSLARCGPFSIQAGVKVNPNKTTHTFFGQFAIFTYKTFVRLIVDFKATNVLDLSPPTPLSFTVKSKQNPKLDGED